MKNKRKKYRKPNAIIYAIFLFACKILSVIKFNLKIKENELKNKKGGFIVLANHESALDFVNIARALNRRTHFVISNAFYKTFPLGKVVEKLGLIPKNQFQTVPSDLIKMKTVIENEMPLVIFPAGLMPENGICTPIPKATGKALKWLNVDVYVAKSNGSYLTNPKWSKKWRKGITNLSITKLVSKEELTTATSEELQERLESALAFDAYKINDELKVAFKNGDNVVGLENVLYKCPKCNSKYSIVSKNLNTLSCTKCNYEVYSDKYGILHGKNEDAIFKYPSDWSLYIEKQIEEEILKNPEYKLESVCEVYMIDEKKHKFKNSGTATIKLTKDGFNINGIVNGESLQKQLSIKNFPSLPLKPGKNFDVQEDKIIYRISPLDPKTCTEWVSAVEVLYKLQNI
ncbi:MAG: 1-acyl-sn-glycerol-3-phosphate acyltransferase [Clostridia bacterium]|nr:1-acyl-sn-glycerol-3-phosphate acyltransferase [Clostridia bacterium]